MTRTDPEPTGLTVNGRRDEPTIPNDGVVSFGWRIDDPDWGDEQEAYRVLLARFREGITDRTPLWDSKRVTSAESVDVTYDGPSLAADTRYWFAVRVWNEDGTASAWSNPRAFWTAPAIDAEWLAHAGDVGDTNGYRSNWRVPDEGPEWVQVDLGERRRIAAVCLHPAEPFGGPTTPDGRTITARDTEGTYRGRTRAQGPVAFGFPQRYRVEIDDDPVFAEPTVLADSDEPQPDPRRDSVTHDATGGGRYVRIVATDLDSYSGGGGRIREEHGSWAVFALAGLSVLDEDGTDLAVGKSVTSSSSVESETWGTDHLTNGVYESRMGDGSPLFRREVILSKTISEARVHVAGLGYGELYINGEKVGDAVLDPGWTQYAERVLYRSYDVTDQLITGENALGLWLGRGWFGKPTRQWPGVTSPRGLLHLTIEFEDGTTRTVASDGGWRSASSPIEMNDIYDGEHYDARREQNGWAEPGFDDEGWEPARVVPGPDGDLFPQQTPPIRVTETLNPVAIHDREDGPVVDFGQNATGWVELTIRNPNEGDSAERSSACSQASPGEPVTIHHAEALNDDGSLQTTDLRTARATDTYIPRGDDTETYEPRFTYHGFRYAQVIGYPGELMAADITAKVVHTDFGTRGSFSCANEDLNRVHENARWGLRSNAHSVPTDCPQRDERQGFTGDGHLAAGALQYNFDTGQFHEKFLRDHADAQSPHGYIPSKVPNGSEPEITGVTWTYSFLALPWRLYCHDATDRALKAHYEDLCRFVDFWHEVTEDDLLPDGYTAYGDWVALENTDGRRGKPEDLFTNAYLYRVTDILACVARVLGCDADAERYQGLADDSAAAFNEQYFDAERGGYGPGTQAANAVPLAFELVPEEQTDTVAASLAESVRDASGQLRTGFLGTPNLLTALSRYGYPELAYEVATQPEYPGWVYMLRNGATTVWERWDTDEQVGSRMNSRNHSPFTLISEWCYEVVAGLRVSEALPEERCVDVVPGLIESLEWAEASVQTPYGEVATRWERDEGDLLVRVEIPWNLTARVHPPRGHVVATGENVRDDSAVDGAASNHDVSSEMDFHRSASERSLTVRLGPGSHSLRIDRTEEE